MKLTWTSIASAAGVIATFVLFLDNFDALAARFPALTPASHSFVIERVGDLVGEFNDLKWNQAYERAGRLTFELQQQQYQELQLQQQVTAAPDDLLRAQFLQQLKDTISDKQHELARLNCQIQNHSANASCLP